MIRAASVKLDFDWAWRCAWRPPSKPPIPRTMRMIGEI